MSEEFHLPRKTVLIRWPRPEQGDEREEFFFRYHNCPGAERARAESGDPDIDLMLYPIGLAGWEMPSGVPFEVPSAGACGVCGGMFRLWAEWVSNRFLFL